jgi:hypothetical protein
LYGIELDNQKAARRALTFSGFADIPQMEIHRKVRRVKWCCLFVSNHWVTLPSGTRPKLGTANNMALNSDASLSAPLRATTTLGSIGVNLRELDQLGESHPVIAGLNDFVLESQQTVSHHRPVGPQAVRHNRNLGTGIKMAFLG